MSAPPPPRAPEPARRSPRTHHRARADHYPLRSQGGYAVKPSMSAGNFFMKHGREVAYHAKVDFAKLAYA